MKDNDDIRSAYTTLTVWWIGYLVVCFLFLSLFISYFSAIPSLVALALFLVFVFIAFIGAYNLVRSNQAIKTIKELRHKTRNWTIR